MAQKTDVKTPAEDPATPESSAEEIKVEATAPEAKVEEAKATVEETEGETDEESSDEESKDETKADTEETEPPKRDADSRKEQLNSEIRTLVARRNDLRTEVADINAKVYQPQTAEELVSQGVDPAMARIEALEQRNQMSEFNAHVSDLNANLNTEALQVMHDFPVFDPDSVGFDQTLANRAAAVYQRAANPQTDPRTGMIIQANVLPYDIFKAFAETHSTGAQNGEVSGQRAAERMLAAAETTSSSAPKKAPIDNFLKGLTGEAE